jgi:predicted membrane protein (TIGR00267 family)
MSVLQRISLLLHITRAHGIARRYFVVNGFDGALTMLGLNMGFYTSGTEEVGVILSACLGAAIALGASGISSAYISEAAEKQKELYELEQAMIADLSESHFGQATRWVPVLIATINGLAPLLISLIIVLPLVLVLTGVFLPVRPLMAVIGLAFVMIFFLGVFLGNVSKTFWLWAGLRSLAIAVVTSALIYLANSLLA